MSQADYTIADQDGASFLVDVNAQLAAIVSNNSGATEPTIMYAYQWWADTSAGILKQRNAANNAWISILTLSTGAVSAIPDDIVTTAKILDDAVTTAKLAFDTGSLGYRNAIINGGMAIDQRALGRVGAQTITAAAALAYTVDRWYAYCTGANVTGQQVAGSSQSQYRYQFTGAASVTKIGFAQRIEAANSYQLNNGTATLSVDLANSLLTTVTWTAWYANTADTFGTLASPTRTQISTGTFTVNSTVTRYNTNITVPAAATTGIEIEFSVGAQTSGTWTIGNVQLEAGSVATPYENRSYGIELALCQRYLPSISTSAVGILGTGATTTTSAGYVLLPIPIKPRVIPTGITVLVALSNYGFQTSGGAISTPTAITFANASFNYCKLNVTGTGTPYTANQPAEIFTGAGNIGIILTGCEL